MSATLPILPESSPSRSSDEFASAIQAMKALHVMLVSVMTELAALRRTMLDTPELRELYEQNLREATSTARPILAEAMECYETMISGPGATKLQN